MNVRILYDREKEERGSTLNSHGYEGNGEDVADGPIH